MPAGYTEVINFLRGGLNTALDPSNIGDDQLQEATGMEYRPPRQGLFGVGGRTRFDASGQGISVAAVHGLVFAQFDVSATSVEGHRFVAFCGTSAMGASGVTPQVSFSTLKSNFTSGATNFADGVHYGNNWYFWNGVDPSWRLDGQSMVASAVHGLTAITTALVAVATAGGGPSTIGTYDVWITEYKLNGSAANGRYFPNVDPAVECIYAATGGAASVTLSATGMQIKATYPATVINGDNIGFRVYTTIANAKFPFGYAETKPPGSVLVADNVASGVVGTDLYMDVLDSGTIVGYPYGIVQPPGGVAVSSKGAPPTPYDMAVFQDSLVAIDVADRQTIRYSLADSPHAWPSTYYIRFETEKQDTLNALEVCNNALLVFSSWYGYRVDDLPRATDGDEIFAGRSRAKEPFSTNHGCVSPRGTCVFDIYGSGQLCAFVCRDGIHLTDGFKTDYLTTDLDWAAEVNLAYLSQTKLLNNPKRHRIEFYYYSLTVGYWARLDFYYYPGMLDASQTVGFPKLPMLGPNIVPGPAATLGTANNDWQVWCGLNTTFNGSGAIFTEGSGATDDALLTDGANTTVNKRWRTKDWYFAGQGGEFEIERAYLAQAQTTASGTYTVTAHCRTDDLGTFNATATVNQALKGNQPVLTLGQTRAQSVSLRGAKDDGGTWQEINYIVWVVKDRERLMSAKSSV